jgi:hypothetical protein
MNTKTLRAAMKEMGRRGGKARARRLTATERTEQARKGGLARQAKARGAKRGGTR